MKGRVKWFNHAKGYGFIISDDKSVANGEDIFVHISDITKGTLAFLRPEIEVRFEIMPRGVGWKAVNVVADIRFEIWTLPAPCSHRWAIKDRLDNTVAIFTAHEAAIRWGHEKIEQNNVKTLDDAQSDE